LYLNRLLGLTLWLPSLLGAEAVSGSVTGSVLDAQTGRPISGVAISVDGQTSDKNVTDADGRYSIPLSPGVYNFTFTSPNYSDVQVAGVLVKAGEDTETSTVMSNKSIVTSIEVSEKANSVASTEEAMLTERKLAPTINDGISRQEMAAGVASNAAGALETVTGVSVVGDGFVYVRGLGERYSSTMLNGAMIPTTQPEKRVLPLDLFPASLLENVSVVKTYTPDLPAEFAGGVVQMQTVDFPARKMLNVAAKGGFNTATTFNPFLTYPGGSLDFFGFDDGTRSLPSSIPVDGRLIQGTFSPSQLQAYGRSFANNWEPTPIQSVRPQVDVSAVGGGTFGRLGIVGAFAFNNRPQYTSEFQRYLRQGNGSPVIFTEYPNFNEYVQQAQMGGVFNAAIRLTPNQKIIFRNTLTHETQKEAREFSGYDGGTDTNLASQRLRWIESNILASGVEGDHALPEFRNSVFHWQFTYSRSTRDEPDLREVLRGQLPDGRYIFAALGSSGVRFFSDLSDEIYEPLADFSIPFFKGKISGIFKTGFRATMRSRGFQARRFLFSPQQTSTLDLFADSNSLFKPANIRPNGFQVVEFTRGTDAYTADMDIYGGYTMADVALGSRLRVVGGVRIENSTQIVNTLDNRIPNATPVTATLSNTDPAPAVNVIYALTGRQNLRASYSRTLSRPDFRELSPFDFNNVLGGFVTQGNPNLKRATIDNYDGRWEWFPGGNQVIAASIFAKQFKNPIEQTILPSNDLRQTFVNAKGARNYGVELEFRRALGSYWSKLRPFAVSSNFTYVNSNIEIDPNDAILLTSSSRPLLGQSQYIANFIGEWQKPKWFSNARFYANYVSRKVTDVGTFGLPDIYQEGNTYLAFVYQYTFAEKSHWGLRFEGENLGNTPYRWTQGNIVVREYQIGRTFQVGVSYSVF
jgi:outer membrane receptor protein involved in Fe transport